VVTGTFVDGLGGCVIRTGVFPFKGLGCDAGGNGGKDLNEGEGILGGKTVAAGVGNPCCVGGPGVTGRAPGSVCGVCGVLVLGVCGRDNLDAAEVTAFVALLMSWETSACSLSELGSSSDSGSSESKKITSL
jgi:hypothetical protein